ncbi:ricin-type beta-trefoil lectin domain protein [Actinoallomurus acaciae]|uniref:Ricin-type beta-trefoil lectin domain protein n=1 Tax=Actinoallomurus acaciae TaxID=502577 RepID=A0ABV5YQ82_9ACTN
MRGDGEKKGIPGILVGGVLAVALVAAGAIGVGALTTYRKASGRAKTTAAYRSPMGSVPPTVSASPSPIAPPAVPGVSDPRATPSVPHKGPGAPDKAAASDASSGRRHVAALAVASHSLVSYASGRCADISGGGRANAPVQIWSCTGASWQKWMFASGTIRSGGLCMTATGSNGAAIVAAACNGGAAQRFVLKSSLDIVHSGTSECVDVKDNKTVNGTPLQLWKCSGTSNQKWHTA